MEDAIVIHESAALATLENAPKAVLEEARQAAKALRDVISQKARPVLINGEQYLEFEDWQTLGRFYGVTAGEVGEPEYVEYGEAKGFRATSVAMDRTGREISRATSFCLSEEERWAGRPLFQMASMAQTRANAKALRNVLAWVVVLAGYRPTPAEEMDGVVPEKRTAPATSQSAPASKGDKNAPARPEDIAKLKAEVLRFADGDTSRIAELSQRITTGKNFAGFKNLDRLKYDWQVQNAFRALSGLEAETLTREPGDDAWYDDSAPQTEIIE